MTPRAERDRLVAELRRCRRAAGLTQPELAQRIGMAGLRGWQHLSAWECGRYAPCLANLIKWANALGLAIELRPR